MATDSVAAKFSLGFGEVVGRSRVEWVDVWVFAPRIAALKAIELNGQVRALRNVCSPSRVSRRGGI
jgi:hypothetical protein